MKPLRLLRMAGERILRQKLTLSEDRRRRFEDENTRLFCSDTRQSDLTVCTGGEPQHTFSERVASVLDFHGIVVIEGLVPTVVARRAGNEVLSLIGRAKSHLGHSGHYEDEVMLAQADGGRLQGYHAMAKFGKPVLNMRRRTKGKQDGGMIDIFGFERLLSRYEACGECYARLGELIDGNSLRGAKRQQLNVYCNESVVCTRGLHIDSLSDSYKIFLYLTDVITPEDGPFLYVPGSHKNREAVAGIMRRNRRYRNVTSTDMHVHRDAALKLYGVAGTVLIACQRGIHGGLPQAEGSSRVVMVDNYYN